jgi:hypothetical protein
MSPPARPTRWQSTKLMLRALQVRVRLIAVFVAAFLIVGRWDVLQTYWQRWTAGQTPPPAISSDTEYWCPMDPAVISDWPAMCPVCNMKLVRRSKQDAKPLPDGVLARMQFSPYRIQLAGIRTAAVENRTLSGATPVVSDSDDVVTVSDAPSVLSIPDSAVIDNGAQKIVYVETGAGMFDAIEVKLGDRSGGYYSVLAGLKPGQRVAAAGAFLIDAETHLNPNAAASYFGATSQATAKSPSSEALPVAAANPKQPKHSKKTPTAAEKQEIAAALAELSAADRALAERQVECPVTELPLGSMGKPVRVEIEGRTLFLCCEGCVARLRKDPQKFLTKATPSGSE